jgi:hypothetical protein
MESNYSSLITPPKFSQVNVGQNIYDIGEYRKILNGENSRRMPGITHPVGRVYVAETGIMCNDIKTGQSVPRHTIIDVKMSKDKTGKNGILDSAYSDFDAAGSSNIFEDANRKFSDKCMSVDVNEIDKTGKRTVVKTKYLSLAEIERSQSSIFSGVVPTIPKEFKESFLMPGLVEDSVIVEDRVTVANFMKHMDGGQRFFVGTLAVMGLYMYHQLLYGKRV